MLFFLRAWRLRSQQSAVNTEVDDLIFLYGANAYEEARRRRAHANDLSAARHWSAVKSEVGRRILEVCGDAASLDRLSSRLVDSDDFGCAIWDPPAENRAEARRLAAKIEATQGDPSQTGAGGELLAFPLAVGRVRAQVGRRGVEALAPAKSGRAAARDLVCDA
ncbi:hypothetical protein DFR50_11525 [Roseiarcus fermentans]|uniref:Uncharacterized protein n=1 Tax=Roseiarcus fermentans TaxID=1473586 RepID=A0A366FBA3_9HYPH|nr:hypothetical protein [Roseiarcus fermentans]RBP11918.1 hypothetical protein DFR50_11525 [Roseiarcus fermentans]